MLHGGGPRQHRSREEAFELHMLRCNERTSSLFHSGEEKYTNIGDDRSCICKIIILKLNVKYS